MSADDAATTDPDLAALREYFAGRLPERLREIDEAWRAVQSTGWNGEAAQSFHRLAHSLSGAGATFGFPAVTDAAHALELLLKPALHGPPPDAAAVAELLARLARAAHP